MAINPYIDLYGAGPAGPNAGGDGGILGMGRNESPWGDLSTLGPALGSSAATGTPLPLILAIAASLLGDLFGKKEDPMADAMALQQQMAQLGFQKPYQSPYAGMADEATLRAVLGQLKQTSGWGWPADRQPDMSWLEDMIPRITSSGGTRRRP